MRFFLANDSRVSDGFEKITDFAEGQDLCNFSISIGDHAQTVVSCEPQQYLARVRADVTPVSRYPGASDKVNTNRFVGQTKFVQQVRIVDIPESVIYCGVFLLQRIEFVFSFPFKSLQQVAGRKDPALMERIQHHFVIGEKKRVPHIKEKRLDRHASSVSRGKTL